MIEPQRPLKTVPKKILWWLIISFGLQIAWHSQLPSPQAQIQQLKSPPPQALLRVLSFGDPVASAKILMLWLQSFDNQAGQFISYQKLNYDALQQWLEQILRLDPNSQYPLLAASHIYSHVANTQKQRQMLEFVYQQFFFDPAHRWPWLAHATVLAKHRLKDLPLALKYAKAIAKHADENMPLWAPQMQIFILEDMGELEQARLIIGGMLTSGKITDPNEIKFLNDKLHALEQKNPK
jgi:hypothetical protein